MFVYITGKKELRVLISKILDLTTSAQAARKPPVATLCYQVMLNMNLEFCNAFSPTGLLYR